MKCGYTITDYNDYYQMIWNIGRTTAPRGQVTREVRDVTTPWPALWIARRRRDNPAIGLIEGLQLVAGTFDHDAITAAAPRARLDLFTHQSAYGPRVGDQLLWVIEQLREDPASRRAVVMIADPREPLAERPCTTSLQFQVAVGTGAIDCTATMRSSDTVWGLPYDLIQFGMATHVVASCLGRPVGRVITHLANAHIYEATATDDQWSSDWVNLPGFDDFVTWRQWAQQLSDKHLTGPQLMNLFLASAMPADEPEYVMAHVRGTR